MTTQANAPIALFVYRRVDLLKSVLEALARCPEFSRSPFYVFSDGAKGPEGAADVAAVREFLRVHKTDNMQIIEADANRGLAASIIRGVTELCERYGRVIVLEDDLVVSPHVLTWFNSALDAYSGNEEVMQVSGHVFGTPGVEKAGTGFFAPLTTSWGWATWRRAWDRFDPGARGWEALATDRSLRSRFDFDGCYPFSKMLEKQMAGLVDSWAIRWYWSVFNAQGLVLFPPYSLVQNLGVDDRATHKSLKRRVLAWFQPKSTEPQPLEASALPLLPSSVTLREGDVAALRREMRRGRG